MMSVTRQSLYFHRTQIYHGKKHQLTTVITQILVVLKLLPYRQISIKDKQNHKLNPRYYGLFEIERRIGQMAYRLKLPLGSTIHLVLHVSRLKLHLSRGVTISCHSSQLKIYPQEIMSHRAIKHNNVAVPQLLIRWTNLPPKDASWEDYDILAAHYPTFIF
jgi:Chromo (CHRromatin Organisation MOdifier) domain